MGKRLVALSLCTAILVGCGSGSSSSPKVNEYSLSEYEGRAVSTDSLAGTWVAVGTGYFEYNYSDGTSERTDFAIKEYFIISESGDAYEKQECNGGNEVLTLVGDEVNTENFVGVSTDKKLITGKLYENDFDDVTSADLTMIKISDSVNSIGSASVNVAGSGIDSVSVGCFQQSNGVGTYEEEVYGSFKNYTVGVFNSYNQIFYERQFGEYAYQDLEVYTQSTDAGFGSYTGDTIVFDVNEDNTLTSAISFSAVSSGSEGSLTGTISINLPVQ